MTKALCTGLLVFLVVMSYGQDDIDDEGKVATAFKELKFRNIGPFRGGRSVAVAGVPGDPQTYFMGSTGGGIWKTTDAGITWSNISDGQLKTGSVGAIAVAPSDVNVIYAGMGEHAVRGVMTSHGDGVYKSVDAGKTWKHIGLSKSRHISEIRIHPDNPEVVYIAVQGAVHGDSPDRGVYKSTDGGQEWHKILYVDETTGAADLTMDVHNPRILFASMWDHRRYPWQVRSGGPGSAIYKSTDAGESWKKVEGGLPEKIGKSSVDISPANPLVVYANIESEGDKGGVYRSDDGGKKWSQTSKDRITVARAWYYIEIFADPVDEHTVYVLNAPVLKSIDGGKSFVSVSNPHGDQHHLWINPDNAENIILANDGGACITFNGGDSWSSQQNQPTSQFYRVITDRRFPYHVYGGQQDNSSVITTSRTLGAGIGWKDWISGPGCESAFMAFDPDNPTEIFGGCYQGNIEVMNLQTGESRDIMAYPVAGLGWIPSDMKYRFNWNAPIVADIQDPKTIYHAGNVVLRTVDGGLSWTEISPDLTRNDKSKQVAGGAPYTSEGAGGEVYNTIAYLELSPHDAGVIWTGSDCGLVHVTRDRGARWNNVTPKNLGEVLINSIDVSPHDPGTAYVAATGYKFNDFSPMVFVTKDYGKNWKKIINGIADESFVRVVREDEKVPGILYAGTETGLYISFNSGTEWHPFQLNLPVCPINDLTFADNDLVVATAGRSFWILDDLGAIQQSRGKLAGQVQLFQPKDSYRVPGSGRFRPGQLFGQNPAAGVTLDYYLPEAADSSDVVISIYSADGNLINTFSNKKDKHFESYTGGPSVPSLVPVKKGVNRFSWNMRRADIPGVKDVFLLGNYNGALVPPGTYTVRLVIDGEEKETTANLVADPRVKASPEDYMAQYKMLISLETMVKDVQQTVIDMRAVKSQLTKMKDLLASVEAGEALGKSAKSLIDKIDSWEQKIIQPKQKTFQDVINFPNKLNAEIVNLMGRIASHDPKVSDGARQRLMDLQKEYEAVKTEWKSLREGDLASFNAAYKAAGLDVIHYPDK